MSYLMDANAMIAPYQTYYAFDLVPRFWSFLSEQVTNETIVIIDKVYDEIATNKDKKKPSDGLQKWIETLADKKKSVKTAEIIKAYQDVINYINTSDKYSESAARIWADKNHADAWLVATAKAEKHQIITFETKKGTSKNAQSWSTVKIPNVCEDLNVECVNLFGVLRNLGFRA